MRVPGVVFASEALLPAAVGDRSLEQVENVATLPGIVRASYAMPDIHWGYGFPIGGVAATDVAAGGVVSPRGVGFDISCEVATAEHADVIALGWAQDLSPGKAAVVRDVLGKATVPLMLLPLSAHPGASTAIRPAHVGTAGPGRSATSRLRSR